MKCFRVWLENRGRNNMTTSYYNNTQKTSDSFSSHDWSMDQSLPPALRTFAGWYNSHRGQWDQVMSLAKDPKSPVAQFLKQAVPQLANPIRTPLTYGSGGEEEFNIDAPTTMEILADQLEKLVQQEFPNHVYKDSGTWSVPVNYQNYVTNKTQQATPQQTTNNITINIPDAIRNLSNRQDNLERKVDQISQKVGFTSGS